MTKEEQAENRKKWLEALRSGQYDQTKMRLVRVEDDGKRSYCCLGVLCELSGLEVDVSKDERGPHFVWEEFDEKKSTAFLPPFHLMVDKYGFYDRCPAVRIDKVKQSKLFIEKIQPAIVRLQSESGSEYSKKPIELTELNDHGLSFEDIAQFIEENEEELVA